MDKQLILPWSQFLQTGRQLKTYTVIREVRDECTNTSFKSGPWFDSFPHGPLFFLPCLQLFNECLHSACYSLKLCSKRQISLHSSTHYGGNALCPHSLLLHTFSDSCRVHVRPIWEPLKVIRFHLSPVFNISLTARPSAFSSAAHSTFSHVSSLSTLFILILLRLCICCWSSVAAFLFSVWIHIMNACKFS